MCRLEEQAKMIEHRMFQLEQQRQDRRGSGSSSNSSVQLASKKSSFDMDVPHQQSRGAQTYEPEAIPLPYQQHMPFHYSVTHASKPFEMEEREKPEERLMGIVEDQQTVEAKEDELKPQRKHWPKRLDNCSQYPQRWSSQTSESGSSQPRLPAFLSSSNISSSNSEPARDGVFISGKMMMNSDVSGNYVEGARGNMERTRGNMERARSNMEGARSSWEGSKGNIEQVRSNMERVRGNVEGTRGNMELVRGNVEGARGNVEGTRGNMERVRGNMERALAEEGSVSVNVDGQGITTGVVELKFRRKSDSSVASDSVSNGLD